MCLKRCYVWFFPEFTWKTWPGYIQIFNAFPYDQAFQRFLPFQSSTVYFYLFSVRLLSVKQIACDKFSWESTHQLPVLLVFSVQAYAACKQEWNHSERPKKPAETNSNTRYFVHAHRLSMPRPILWSVFLYLVCIRVLRGSFKWVFGKKKLFTVYDLLSRFFFFNFSRFITVKFCEICLF